MILSTLLQSYPCHRLCDIWYAGYSSPFLFVFYMFILHERVSFVNIDKGHIQNSFSDNRSISPVFLWHFLIDKFRSKHRKRVPFSVNLPARAMACRTDFACWEVSQTLLKILSLPTTPHRAALTKFWKISSKSFPCFLLQWKLENAKEIQKKCFCCY